MEPTIRFIYGLAASVISEDLSLHQAERMLAEDIAKNGSAYPRAIAFFMSNISDSKIGLIIAELCLAAARAIGRDDLEYHCSHQLAAFALSDGKYEKAIMLYKDNIAFLESNSRSKPIYRLLLARECICLANVFNSRRYRGGITLLPGGTRLR